MHEQLFHEVLMCLTKVCNLWVLIGSMIPRNVRES